MTSNHQVPQKFHVQVPSLHVGSQNNTEVQSDLDPDLSFIGFRLNIDASLVPIASEN